MTEAAEHFRFFFEDFNRFLEDMNAGRVGPEERAGRKSSLHDLAVEGIESWRQEHRRGWGHDLVIWALNMSGRVDPPPPTPGRYLLHVLYTEYPESIEAYKRFFHKATGGTIPDASTAEWLRDPWGGL